MKTAISIPDDIFAEAERLAKTLKKSRSQLYASAVKEYVARHSDDQITAALNRVYEDPENRESGFSSAAAARILANTEW